MNGKDDKTFDDELMAAAAALNKEVPPARDLWPEIEQAITEPVAPSRSPWGNIWAQAAAVLLLVGGSSGVTYMAMSGDTSPTPTEYASNAPLQDLEFQPVSSSFGSLYYLGPEYQDARRSLSSRVDEELARLPAEDRELVEHNMQVIRTAIDDINKALAEEPDNALLQKILIRTYREELDLMMKVEGITSAAMRRGDI